jgi:hypothetical protein
MCKCKYNNQPCPAPEDVFSSDQIGGGAMLQQVSESVDAIDDDHRRAIERANLIYLVGKGEL